MEMFDHLSENHILLPDYALWGTFGLIVASLLMLDLFVFHRKSVEPNFRSTLRICLAYMSIALLFGLFISYEKGIDQGMLYFTGYLVEFSLSMDNIFVISLVFSSLRIPSKYQHRVLFWGVLGAVCMRAAMILLGDKLVSNFHWILYLFSAFLVYTGIKMLFFKEKETNVFDSKLFQFIEKNFHVSRKIHGDHFWIKENGKHLITPLLFALIVVELMDVIFAVDSIPAIFLITQDVFIIYTSNIFAILGLRSLYFLLAAAVNRFVYLKQALAIILIFIGSKIFLPYFGIEIASWLSLVVTFGLIAGGIALSLLKKTRAA